MRLLEIRQGNRLIGSLFINRIELVSEGGTRYELTDVDGDNIGFIVASQVSLVGENTAKPIIFILEDKMKERMDEMEERMDKDKQEEKKKGTF